MTNRCCIYEYAETVGNVRVRAVRASCFGLRWHNTGWRMSGASNTIPCRGVFLCVYLENSASRVRFMGRSWLQTIAVYEHTEKIGASRARGVHVMLQATVMQHWIENNIWCRQCACGILKYSWACFHTVLSFGPWRVETSRWVSSLQSESSAEHTERKR